MIPYPTTIDYLRDVIKTSMNLPDSRVNIYNQKFIIPNDPHLFVGIEYKFSKVFASKSELNVYGTEEMGLNTQEHYAIMLFSRNLEALQRKEEAVMALGSIYARQQGDGVGFSIARIAPIQDLSGLEGAAILYRYDIDVVMLCRYFKTNAVNWYGTFSGEVTAGGGGVDITETFTPEIPN